jgi:hypothetical protein
MRYTDYLIDTAWGMVLVWLVLHGVDTALVDVPIVWWIAGGMVGHRVGKWGIGWSDA